MIDPLDALAFSVHSNKGVYALLIGSGVSRAANIPTGWEIVEDLVRKIAHIKGGDIGSDPFSWFQNEYGHEPRYSKLLEELAKTPSERQRLLRSYFEPTDDEREEGRKAPTVAHKAIADLVSSGHIRTIITTNFDRLLETAIEERCITPTIISSVDDLEGALPLIHSGCTVIKLHGDYLDTRIKNSPEELSEYDGNLNALLDRVLDEFGLIVCGWSGEWDTALRNAILRSPNRRFAMYWASRVEPKQHMKELIDHRRGNVIRVEDADGFFQKLSERILALEEYDRPHPISVKMAVSNLKKYISEDKYRIQLHDLFVDETKRVVAMLQSDFFGNNPPPPEGLEDRMRRYEASMEILLHIGMHGALWCDDKHFEVFKTVLGHLCNYDKPSANYIMWQNLQLYPAALFFYIIGLSNVASDNYRLLKALVNVPVQGNTGKEKPSIKKLPLFCLVDRDMMRNLPNLEDRYAPLNDWVYHFLSPYLEELVVNKDRREYLFDKFEYLVALAYLEHTRSQGENHAWAPLGCYGYRTGNRAKIHKEIRLSIEQLERSPYIISGLIGDTVAHGFENLQTMSGFIKKVPWY